MRLVSAEGHSLELRVLGYLYPREARAEYDSNWLNIEARVAHPRGNWSFQDPCLLTYEVAHLADWLEAVACGRSTDAEASFTEPNLRFEHVPSLANGLRVYFELESRPPWASSRVVDEADCFIEFPVSELDLRRAAASLREQTKRYPKRAQR